MKIYLAFTLCILIISKGLTQSDNVFSEKNIFLFGENHFVGEKYDEIKESIFSIIDTTRASDTVHLFLELPTSSEYVIYRLKEFGDTAFFNDYYNNLYYEEKAPTNYWPEFRHFITTFIKKCESKGIEWYIRCIDIEKSLRGTAYVLNHFNNELDSLLSQKYVVDDSTNRKYLINRIDEMKVKKNINVIEASYLRRISESLSIKCRYCQSRDSLMFSNFKILADTIKNTIFGIFGYVHLMEHYDYNEYKKNSSDRRNKLANGDVIPFYGLFSENLKKRAYKIGIIAFKIIKPNSFFKLEINYEDLMDDDERYYLKQLFGGSNVLRLKTYSHLKDLTNLNKTFDHLIIYKESVVNW